MMFPAVPIESLKVWFQWGEAEAFCQCVGAVWEMRQQVAWQRCKKKTWLDSNWRSVVVPYISKKCLCLLFCYKWCINLVVYIMFMFNDLFCHRWGTKQHFIRKSEAFQNPFWDHAMMVIGLWESYGIIPTGAEKNQVVNKLYPDFW